MHFAVEEAGFEQSRDVFRSHRTVRDAPVGSFHFNQRLQPEHAARTVAHERDVETTRFCFVGDRARHAFGAHRKSSRVTRDIDAYAHWALVALSMRKSATFGETRP